MDKNYLALIDLDGTLIDTSEINYQAYKAALEEKGFSLSRDYFMNYCFGNHYKKFLPQIIGDDPALLDEIHHIKINVYSSKLNYARKNENLINILKSIKSQYFLVIATTASRKNAHEVLEYCGLLDMFDSIIAQEDVTKVKPDPECYNLAIDRYKIDKNNTIIFDDSDFGIEAALRCGCNIFKVVKF